MDHGISFLPDAVPETKAAVEYYRDALRLCEIADREGLRRIKMTEHYLGGYGGYCPSPLTFLAAVAARTSQVRLMTGGILPSFHHPVQTASECAMVDAMSGGRLDVGFARGYLPYEFQCFGLDVDQSRDRFERGVDAIVRLWTEECVTMRNAFFAFQRATTLPRPVQRPHPPIWVAAVRSRRSFAWIGEKGFGLLVTTGLTPPEILADHIAIYRESYAPPIHNPGQAAHVTISLPLYVAPSDREASDEADAFLQHYLDVWAKAAEAWNTADSTDYPGYAGLAHAIRGASPAQLREQGCAIAGSPERARDLIQELCERVAVDAIVWQIDFGAMPREPAERSLRLFTSKVLPYMSAATC